MTTIITANDLYQMELNRNLYSSTPENSTASEMLSSIYTMPMYLKLCHLGISETTQKLLLCCPWLITKLHFIAETLFVDTYATKQFSNENVDDRVVIKRCVLYDLDDKDNHFEINLEPWEYLNNISQDVLFGRLCIQEGKISFCRKIEELRENFIQKHKNIVVTSKFSVME